MQWEDWHSVASGRSPGSIDIQDVHSGVQNSAANDLLNSTTAMLTLVNQLSNLDDAFIAHEIQSASQPLD